MKKTLWALLVPVFFLFASPIFSVEKSLTLKEKIIQGKEGDFIVTHMRSMYTVILIRQITPHSLLLEEISAPENQIDKGKMNWVQWVSEFAPGHSSWSSYEIDLSDNTLRENFSFTHNGWMEFENSDYIYAHFLTLPLTRVSPDQRHRIGPPPAAGEFDNRSYWSPPLIFEGKKKEKPAFDALKTTWPKDGLIISDCDIEFYFDANSSFPFPYWLEVKGTHYTFKMPIVDSGKNIVSPQQKSPLRPPEFIGKVQRKEGLLQFTLKSPSYHKKFTLYAADASGVLTFALPIPFSQKKGEGKDLIVLEVSEKDLNSILIPGHRYRWMVIPDNAGGISAETEDLFLWTPAP